MGLKATTLPDHCIPHSSLRLQLKQTKETFSQSISLLVVAVLATTVSTASLLYTNTLRQNPRLFVSWTALTAFSTFCIYHIACSTLSTHQKLNILKRFCAFGAPDSAVGYDPQVTLKDFLEKELENLQEECCEHLNSYAPYLEEILETSAQDQLNRLNVHNKERKKSQRRQQPFLSEE